MKANPLTDDVKITVRKPERKAGLAATPGSETGKTYPATMIVHTPSGPVAACDIHAGKIANLMSFLGAHCAVALAAPGAECVNCANEAKSPNSESSEPGAKHHKEAHNGH